MIKKNARILCSLTVIAIMAATFALIKFPALAQSGGPFEITKSVIAGGGGSASGGTFTLDATLGESFGGTVLTGGNFSLGSGFWANGIVPAAANVAVSGRVSTPDGRGLRNAIVKLSDPNDPLFVTRSVATSASGLYSFDNVQSGRTYSVKVFSKLYRFNPLSVPVGSNDLTGVDFVGHE
ncbi:MAG: carboxypeptidase-like regulatory domain-containing protein [Acidobacteriota bacterium]